MEEDEKSTTMQEEYVHSEDSGSLDSTVTTNGNFSAFSITDQNIIQCHNEPSQDSDGPLNDIDSEHSCVAYDITQEVCLDDDLQASSQISGINPELKTFTDTSKCSSQSGYVQMHNFTNLN